MLANNSGMRFPEKGEPYHGEWVAPRNVSAEQKRELETALSAMKRSMFGGMRMEIEKGLVVLSAHFPNNNSEKQWQVIRHDYADELSQYPQDIVLEAMRQWKLQGRFFPKLSELVKLIEPLMAERRSFITRAEILLNRKPKPDTQPHVRDPNVESGLSKLVASLKAKCR